MVFFQVHWLDTIPQSYSGLHSSCLFVENLPISYKESKPLRELFSHKNIKPVYCQVGFSSLCICILDIPKFCLLLSLEAWNYSSSLCSCTLVSLIVVMTDKDFTEILVWALLVEASNISPYQPPMLAGQLWSPALYCPAVDFLLCTTIPIKTGLGLILWIFHSQTANSTVDDFSVIEYSTHSDAEIVWDVMNGYVLGQLSLMFSSFHIVNTCTCVFKVVRHCEWRFVCLDRVGWSFLTHWRHLEI